MQLNGTPVNAWETFDALQLERRVFLGLRSNESRSSRGKKKNRQREGERESAVCVRVCDVGSWKSRGLQNKQAACLRLPCDVTTGQRRDRGRRMILAEKETPIRLKQKKGMNAVQKVSGERT